MFASEGDCLFLLLWQRVNNCRLCTHELSHPSRGNTRLSISERMENISVWANISSLLPEVFNYAVVIAHSHVLLPNTDSRKIPLRPRDTHLWASTKLNWMMSIQAPSVWQTHLDISHKCPRWHCKVTSLSSFLLSCYLALTFTFLFLLLRWPPYSK